MTNPNLKHLNRGNLPKQPLAAFTKAVGSGAWGYGPRAKTLEEMFARRNDVDPECVVALLRYNLMPDESSFGGKIPVDGRSDVNARLDVRTTLDRNRIVYAFDQDADVQGLGGVIVASWRKHSLGIDKHNYVPMPDPLAIMIRHQLRRYETTASRRRRVLEWYGTFGEWSDRMITHPDTHNGCRAVMEFPTEAERRHAAEALRKSDIAYQELGGTLLRLPCHERMTRQDVRYVIWRMATA